MKQLTQHPNEKSNLTKAEFKRRLAAHRRRKQELAKKLEEEMPDRVKLIETQYCDWSTDRAMSTVEDWLQRYPEMNCIITASDDMGLGACNALNAAGKSGWYVGGVDGTKIGIQLAEEGTQFYNTVYANMVDMDRKWIDILLQVIDGTYTEKEYTCGEEYFLILNPDTVGNYDL